jgi:AmmeMemoRadiSam system protein B/AmmeMemoRadiSam system protein A
MREFVRIISVVVLALLFIISWPERGDGTDMKDVRKSVIAGSWYPGNPEILSSDIDGFLKNVPTEFLDGEVVALISPHAGYIYSGQIAAYSYKLLKGKTFDAVIIIGPSHRTSFQGASIYNKGGYETPLGIVPVDAQLANEIIAQSPIMSFVPTAHMQEHSIEIQIPFLQVVLGEFSFVPIVMGDQNSQTCEELANAILKSVVDKRVLIVGSSDLSHFHSYERAVKLDSVVLDHINKMDPEELLKDLQRGACEACGGGPIAVVMMVAERLGADRVKLLKYANSGDVTGDKSGVVGYASAAFYKSNPVDTVKEETPAGIDMGLTETEKNKLLEIARSVIESRISGEKNPKFQVESATLREKRGAFVTLHKHGQLRGCIGFIDAKKPLHKTIEEMAMSAAFNDPRFSPVSREELKDLSIEISVLTPLKEIKDINEIEVGIHGIYIVKGFYSGILLPQVATQYKWDRLAFLKETCHKAGLPSDAWSDKDTRIYIFSADIFGE